jgi:flagellar assembly factor FliW
MMQPEPHDPEAQAAGAGPPGAESGTDDAVTVATRFGDITFDETSRVALPQGVIGFPQFHGFGLTAIPDPRMGQFNLLQCLEQTDLSFFVLPIQLDGSTIADADVEAALATLAIPREDAAFLLIITVRKEAEGISVSANVRAPIILNIRTRTARQYVLPNPEYPIRQML